ncbi:histidine kinase [Kribbella yunnanensis]|uniref:histidine kinase n=1 Tax=Kribbella yunnanensis TaxID=190194 RepID=A0ABN2I0M8_9ACTN
MTDLRWIPEQWRRFDSAVLYGVIGVLLFAGSLVPALHGQGTVLGGMPNRPLDLLAVVAVGLQCVPLVSCRRSPIACLVLVSIGFALDQLRGYHSFAGTAFALAVLNAGWRLERGRRITVLALSAGYLLLVAGFRLLGGGEPPGEFLTFYLAMALAWGIGAWLRSTRALEAERARLLAEETRVAERTELARDLHDIVTHHVTAMVMQAEAARYLPSERLDQSLTSVADSGRQAITDLRQLLDVLDPGDPGDAGPRDLRALVEQTRRAGQPVEFTEEGTPSADPVAYRVVQEALTNALKYAHGSRTAVQVRHDHQQIAVEVTTDGSGTGVASPGGSGRGLAGLRDRVDILGGDFSAGKRKGGGFVVRARIPVGTPS